MARKSRKETAAVAVQEADAACRAAIYVRLSVEDTHTHSVSIETQQMIIARYLEQYPEISVYDTYIDNGATGTNFHRPGFQQMLSDIEAGHVNCVIVKDLSRLGRNTIDTGYYIEQYFRIRSIRFIAVNENFDTANPEDAHSGIIIPLRNMINEAYALDIGRKIRAQQRQAMKDGKFIGARTPYGYLKAEDDCHQLVIDPVAAVVVQRMFRWASEGAGLNTMAILNFSDVLKNVGLDPKRVKLIRHSLGDKAFKKCYDKGMVEEYTRVQSETFSNGYDYWCVFISDKSTTAKFFACYKVSGGVIDTQDTKPKGFPLEDWFQGQRKPTRENASEFISRAIENHADEIMTSKTYADYIATRPRAERIGSHGLFTEEGVQVNLAKVSRELNLHDGNVWTAIISLRREDAERLGYNTGERWRQMLRAQSQELSDQLHIPMQDLKWFAAFHNEGHHPHVHLMLKEHNVDVYFEEQGIHSLQPGAEFYITIYGSIAQSESENISANVRWGKAQSAKEGNVPFHYKRFLGYRRGSDGKPEIDPEQAVTVKRIYERFLAGDSLATIASDLNADGIPTPSGVGQWQRGTIESILTNEKYKGDAVLNKTYIRDCLSKKVMINNGERPKYYVENNHPAIIDSGTFGRVQEEMARRSGKRKVKQVGTKTEQGRYSSKYALTELLICGECGTPYRRCTWAANGKKKVVWRCINRLDYGKKYCHDSPSIEESVLQEAIMKAVMQTARQNAEVLKTLKLHIGMGLSAETTEDNSLDLQIRIAEIEAEFQKMLKAIAADNVEAFDEEKAKALMDEKAKLQIQLDRIADTKQKRKNAKSRLDEIFTIIEALANHPISYDDQIVRQILESVIVESKEKIKVVFVGGLEVTQTM